jgi:hypothetical protein
MDLWPRWGYTRRNAATAAPTTVAGVLNRNSYIIIFCAQDMIAQRALRAKVRHTRFCWSTRSEPFIMNNPVCHTVTSSSHVLAPRLRRKRAVCRKPLRQPDELHQVAHALACGGLTERYDSHRCLELQIVRHLVRAYSLAPSKILGRQGDHQ